MSEARIGKFEVVSRIGAGGMADVYRCRLRGMGGFDKTVVVKRIRPERATDPAFVNMFLDEARLAANLDHPNVVQVFDVGEVDGSPYIAMEYVKGPTLSALVREVDRRGQLNRPEVMVRMAKIVSGICEGLHHAHTARGHNGEPLGLVHRDVSPQNIMVSREGIPKLLDFGVAKANGRLTQSLAGTLKGKLRYLPPERLGGIVDQRGDIFSMGVCLFEATTGQNPYGQAGTDEVELLGNISSGKRRRPSEIVPDYPRALEEIVLAAIDPDVSQRCPSAQELHERLERFAGPTSTRALAGWIRELFPDIEDSGPQPRRRPPISPFNPLAAVLSPDTASELEVAVRSRGPERASRQAASPRAPRSDRRWLALAAPLVMAGAIFLALRKPATNDSVETRPVPVGPPATSPASATALPRAPVPLPPAAAPASTQRRPRHRPRIREAHRVVARATPPPSRQLTAERSPTAVDPAPMAPMGPPRGARTGAEAAEPARGTYSARPLPQVPPPNLPRIHRAANPDDSARVLRQVEDEAVRAGCSPDFARGITAALHQRLAAQRSPDIYPASLYYLIVREAALGREKQVAGRELASAHRSGLVKALNRLPIAQR